MKKNKNERNENKDESIGEVIFDKKQQYTDDVLPLMQQLQDACEKHGLPFMIWVIYSNDNKVVGQGLRVHAQRSAGAAKMAVLANIADDTLGVEQLAGAALAYKMARMFAKSDAEKKTEESK